MLLLGVRRPRSDPVQVIFTLLEAGREVHSSAGTLSNDETPVLQAI